MKRVLIPVILLAIGAPALAAQTAGGAARGKELYAQCVACHGADGSGTASGPDLRAIAGQAAAQQEGFAYSAPLRRSGKRWTQAELQAFLLSPQKAVPGTRMAYAGAGSAENAAALASYLGTLR